MRARLVADVSRMIKRTVYSQGVVRSEIAQLQSELTYGRCVIRRKLDICTG